MQSIRFDDGFKEFMINDDPNRVIRFNPADYGIIERFNNALKNIEKATESLENDVNIDSKGEPLSELEEAAEAVAKVNKLIKDQIDYIFDSPVSDMVFGNKSPLALVKGVPLFERFIMAAKEVIEKEVKKEMEASQKRIEKYTKQVK
jgi:hypothetical protein